jgi:hypothetical protein
METAILLIPPAVNVVVTALFAWVILRQYLRRRRIYQLYWTIALTMAFLATLFYVSMLVAQPVSSAGVLFFRLYYILGGALMPSWLGLGSLALVSNPRVVRICVIILSIMSVLAAVLIFQASIDLPRLSQIAGTPGTGTLKTGAWLVMTIILNTLGVVAVAGVAIYSGWKLLRHQAQVAGLHTANLLRANILILAGAILNGVAGSLARFLGLQSTFWLIMAVGWIVFFIGVLLTGRRSQNKTVQENSRGEAGVEKEKYPASS